MHHRSGAFSMDQYPFLVLDYETRSRADLKMVGGYEYARHESTEILCVGYKLIDEFGVSETKVWCPFIPGAYEELKRFLLNPKVKIIAHNAFFEQVITRFVLSKLIHDPGITTIPINRWICTASLARAVSLPGKLEQVCLALKLSHRKDMTGHRLMLKMSKPRKPTKTNPALWHESKTDLLRLMEYCKADVEAEYELFRRLPPLIEKERKVWELDQKINWRGFRCDRPLVNKILCLIDEELCRFEKATHQITNGQIRSVNQRNATLQFIRRLSCPMPDLRAKTVLDTLSGFLGSPPIDFRARKLLEIRRDSAKTSTAKYEAFEARSRFDSKIRDSLVYHLASTGRFGGAGLQPHNFPRGTIKNTELAAYLLTHPATDLEMVRLLYGNPMEAFSSLLRAMIIPDPGYILFGGDFSSIEVRVLFWIANHDAGLEAYKERRDLYREIATRIYRVKLSEVTPEQRDVGKRAILGCGYGMGWKKFKSTCDQFGQKVDDELALTAVETYRETHFPIPELWRKLERAAIAAVRNPTKSYHVNHTKWFLRGRYLFCELPSGRKLAYRDPKIASKLTPWDEKVPVLEHWGVNPKTKQWTKETTYGGRLCENVVQATARDIMVDAMLRLEDRGYEILLTVHDEILTQRKKGQGSVSEFENLMTELPGWAVGIPIEAQCYQADRYKKG